MEFNTDTYKKALYYLVAGMLLFAPLFRAGDSPIPLMLLQWGALLIFVLMIMGGTGFRQLSRIHLIAVISILLLPILFLIPVPQNIWFMLPGRGNYLDVLNTYTTDGTVHWRSISVVENATEYAFWILLPPVVVYVAAINLDKNNLQRLIYIVIGMAVFQAILGLMQFGQGAGSALYFGGEYGYASGGASGTYRNRNHLAGLLEMIFPIVLALLATKMGHSGGYKSHRDRSWRQRLNFLPSIRGHQAVIYGLIAVLLILALIFTKSRTGIVLAMVGLLLSLFAFFRRLGGGNVYGIYGTAVAIVIVLAVEIGLAPVLDRFSQDPMQDLRWTIFSTSMEGIGNFSPMGSGPGTFPSVYPWYQLQEVNGFITRAHNDYLEWIFEGGFFAATVLLGLLFLYFRNWKVLWIKDPWETYRFIQVGAGIGILLILLHSFVDYNLHKPANAIYFAFLLAVFMHRNDEEQEKKSRRRKITRTQPMPMKPIELNTTLVDPTPDDPDLSDW